MIAKSMTPETDAQTAHYGGLERVPADFARNLERRLVVAETELANQVRFQRHYTDLSALEVCREWCPRCAIAKARDKIAAIRAELES